MVVVVGIVFEVGRTGRLAAADVVLVSEKRLDDEVEEVEEEKVGVGLMEVGGGSEDRGEVVVEVVDVVTVEVDVVTIGLVDSDAADGKGRGAMAVSVEALDEGIGDLVLVGADAVTTCSTVVVAVPVAAPGKLGY